MSATILQLTDLKALADAVLRRNSQCNPLAPDQTLHVASSKERNDATPMLVNAATEACQGLSGYITASKLLAKLTVEDITELEMLSDPLPFLRSFALACVWTDFRRQGIAPPGWDQQAHCDQCGPVLLWASIDVAGCPWCWNRVHGVKVPRP